MQKYMSI